MRAENVDGWGPWSELGSGRTYTPVYRPGQVSTPTVSGDGWESVRVSWVRPWSGGATITDYDVQYREEGSTEDFVDVGYNGTATEARISGLTTGASYEVQVRARNRVGYGSWSASGVGTAAVRVDFGAPAYSAVEGGAGAAVTVTLNEAAVRVVTVPIEVGAAALTEATDYEVSGLSNNAVTFAVGDSSKTVTVTALVDADSADELVDLTLGTLPAGVTKGATATTEVTLSDKDPLMVRLSGPAGLQEGPFEVAVVFSEEVTGFDANDVAANNSTVTVAGSGADYVATVTPSFSGTVTVQVRAEAVQDNAMNTNEASEPYAVEVQRTCLTGNAIADPANNPGLVLDCTVLLGLKDRLAGTAELNWSPEERMDSWTRVTISTTSSRVVALVLNHSDLDGVVPLELGELPELFTLDLSHNELTGGIPSELSNLGKLFNLHLDHNQLEGSIPVELGAMNNLVELGLGHNKLSGSIPAEFGSLPSITNLYLNDNELSGDFPSDWRRAQYLDRLEVQNNQLSGCVPTAVVRGLVSYDLGDLQSCGDGPGRAGAPEISPVGTTQLRVTWSEPVNTGSAISDYDVQYREVGADDGTEAEFVDAEYDGTATETTITGLTLGTSYEVQVRAESADGTGTWSESGLGETSTVTVEFGASNYVANEGGAAQAVTVQLNMAALEEVLVPIEVRGGATTEATDYTPNTIGTLTFAIGETGKTIEVAANEDDDDSAEETVELSFGDSLSGAGPGAVAASTVTLADNDPLRVELTGPTGPVNGAFEVAIRFTEEVTGFEPDEVTVTGGAVELSGSGAEYTAKVTPDGAARVTVEVAAGVVDDDSGSGGNAAAAQFSAAAEYDCSSGVAVRDPMTNTEAVADCGALLAARDELAGTAALNWSADLPMTDWNGVTAAAGSERATELRLAGRGLTGTLPAGLSGLRGLTELDVSDNEVSGRFPSEYTSLSGLTVLKVQDTRLSGCVPEALRGQLVAADSDLGELKYCNEGPGRPERPEVEAAGTTSLTVRWSAPVNTGSAINEYNVQYRAVGTGTEAEFEDTGYTGTATETTITGLTLGTSYEVRVRAENAEGAGAWSEPGSGATPAVVVEFGSEEYTASEGGSRVAVTVELSLAAPTELRIPIVMTPERGDYTAEPTGELTFAESERSKTIWVTASEDDDSAEERVELGFGDLPSEVGAGPVAAAAVTLADNDPLTVELTGPAGPVNGPFEVTITFTEEVTGFEAAEVSVAGGTVELTGSGAVYTATVTPEDEGTVTVDVGAGVVADDSGSGVNEAAAQWSVTVVYNCSSGVAIPSPGGKRGLVRDCEVLLTVQDELAGTAGLNWSLDREISTWDGITIGTGKARNRIARLNLETSGLTGTIPARVGELRKLLGLFLTGNQLTGPLPATLGNLTDLFHLVVDDNELSGDVPGELGNLTSLRVMDLSGNRFSGCVPASMRTHLRTVDLGGLQYCDEGPGRPEPPAAEADGATALSVSWAAPVNAGEPITGYDVQYREAGTPGGTEADFVDAMYDGTATETTITGLTTGTSYEVQVRATSDDGTSPWSESGTGATADVAVEFGAEQYTASEGGSGVPVTVSLTPAAAEQVEIAVTLTAGAGTEVTDYAPTATQRLTFAVGESEKTIEVRALEDDDSAEETVELGFDAALSEVGAGTVATARVTLADNDPLTVGLTGPSGTVDGAFEVAIAFTEEVTGFDAHEVTVSGGTVELAGSGAQFTATVRPDGAATVTVEVVAGVVDDDSGLGGNAGSEQLRVAVEYDCSSGVAVSDPVMNTGAVADCEVLLGARDELAGTAALNWTAVLPMADWDGVTVGGAASRVTAVRLAGSSLTGTLPAGLSGLADLAALDVSDNEVSGRFPSEYASLSALTELQVQDTRLSGCVPEALRGQLAAAASDLGELKYCSEGPGRPEQPEVAAAGTTSLEVRWLAPANTGSAIDGYDVQYREVGTGVGVEADFVDAAYGGTATETTITGLTPGSRYGVQVRANSADGTGAWSESGFGETASLMVAFGAPGYTAVEGAAAQPVTVQLSRAALETVAVPITVSAGADTEATDYTPDTVGTLTFTVGESSKTIMVTAEEDGDSAEETVELGFGELPGEVAAGTPLTATVTLADNDPLTVALTGPGGPVAGAFEVTITFTEEVTGFEAQEVTVAGGSVELTGSGAAYTATVTPDGAATVTVDVGAGVVADDGGIGGNEEAAQLRVAVEYDCTSGVAIADPENGADLVADCEVLLAARDELAGSATLNWSADLPMAEWDGVTTGGSTERVTELRLAGRSLDGTLPAGLSELAGLTALDVSENGVSGRFPSAYDRLGVLAELQVQDTRLWGCIPERLNTQLGGASDRGDLKSCSEGPEKPEAPVLSVSGTLMLVNWTAPESAEAITAYEVRYGVAGSGTFAEEAESSTARFLTGLLPGHRYEVQVRATSDAGTSPWSEAAVGEIPPVSVGFAAGSYEATEGGAGVPVTVQLGVAAVETVEIPVKLTAGGTTEPTDYTPSEATLTFAMGEMSKAITVTAAEDDGDSAEEAVELGFGELPFGVTAATTTATTVTATVTLADNDPLTVGLTGPAATVDGAFEVTITFTEEVTGFEADAVTVSGGTVELSGSGALYTATVMPDGAATVTVDVAAGVVADDDGSGGNEAAAQLRVPVEYNCSSGVAIEDPATRADLEANCAVLLRARDELAGTASLNWSAARPMAEWDGVTTGGSPERVTELRLAGRSLDGTLPAGLSDLAGLTALDVSDNEVSGRFPGGYGALSALTELQVQDTRLRGCIPASLRTQLGGASDRGDLLYCDEGPEKPAAPQVGVAGTSIAVAWTTPESAQAISRYDVRYGIRGSGSYVEASVTNDSALILWTSPVLMPGRSYEVMIRAESAAGVGPWSEPGVGHIPAVGVGFAVGSYVATEGEAGGVAVTVQLGAAAAETVEIPVTLTAGTGTEAGDYAPASARLTFASGEIRKAFTVTAEEDDDSAEETVELSFGNLPLGVTAATTTATTATATVRLADNDPLTVGLTGPTDAVDGVFEVRITFTEDVTGFEAAEVTVAGGTVALTGSGAEYTATVTPDGAGTVTVDVASGVVDDDDGIGGNEAAAQWSVTVEYDCSSGVAIADAANKPGLVADCEALLAARDELAGTAALNWSGGLALSSWDGVTTGGGPERITGLDLSNRQLDGDIPAGIGDLEGLTALDLSGNELSGLVPEELGNLSSLTELYLQSNRLSGCVPSALGSIAAGSRDFGELLLCGAGPPRPLAPVVSTGGPTSVAVAWTAPSVTGPVIDSYDVRYRKVDEPAFTEGATGATGTSTTIDGLASGSRYEVQVRANGGGESGPWSPSGFGETGMLSVRFAPGPFTAQEGGTGVTVVVSLSAPPAEQIAIPLDTTPVGTTEAGDYELSGMSNGALSFAANQQMATITVAASEDHDSVDEAVELAFGNLPAGVGAGTLTSARVGLIDNDTAPLEVSFGNTAYTAAEGTAGATIPVRLNQPALRGLTVPVIATPRGTTVAADYAIGGTTAGVLTFANGEQTKYVTVVALEDEDANDEAVVLSFGAGVPAGAAATAEVTLEDNDGEPLTISFDAASYTAVEGKAGVWVTVELSQAARIARTVQVTMRGRGTTAAGDYRVSGLNADYEVTFAVGERTKLFAVMAEQDADAVDEQIVLGFGAGVAPGTTPRAVVTLQDDDPGGVSFGAAKYRIAETGFAQVTVMLDPAPRRTVVIPVTITPQGSTTMSEFRLFVLGVSGLTIEPTDNGEKEFIILNHSDADGDDEVLQLSFGELPAGLSAGAVATSTVTVVDGNAEISGEDPPLQVSFAAPNFPATEGGGVVVTVQVEPEAVTAVPVPIRATARGTTASDDYTVTGLTGNAVTIAAGQSTAVFTVSANEDGDAADEVVEVEISSVPPGTKLGVQASAEVLLNDNDQAAQEVNFAAASDVVVEGSGAIEVAVELTQAARDELVVPITVSPRGTTAAGDYAVGGLDEDGAVTFSAGETAQTLTVSALDDADAANEAVVLGIGGGPVPAGETPVSVITLQDNDTHALNATFDASSYTATEGGGVAQVAVTLNQPAASDLALPITVSPRGTTEERDYTVAGLNGSGALEFAAGETSQTFTVAANVDDDEVGEAVVLGIGGVVPAGATPVAVVRLQERVLGFAVSTGSTGSAVSFAPARYTVTEGAEVQVTVRLSTALTEPVAVPVTATPQGGTERSAYTLLGLSHGAMVFEAAQVEKSFTIRANQDDDADDETLVIAFGPLPEGVVAGIPDTATVRIQDDERAVRERIARVNKAVMPHLAQATTASVVGAIGGRVAAARDGAPAAGYDTAGLRRLRNALAAREHDGEIDPSGALPSVEQVLGDSGFVLPLAAVGLSAAAAGQERPGTGPTLWGTGDYQSLGGDTGGAGVSWSGSLFSAHLGFDTPLSEQLLAGVALSFSRGAFDYRDGHESQSGSGTHGSWTLSAYPYLSWSPLQALGLWATLGYGGGSLEVDDEAAEAAASDLTRIAGAGGLQASLTDRYLLPGGTTSVTAKGEGSYTWTAVAGSGLIEALTVQVWRGRLAVEGAHERELPWGASIRPAVEVGVRYDGGDGMPGAGVEVGGGLRYLVPWGLTLEGRGRYLAAHQSAYQEWAAGGRLSLDLTDNRQGLSVSLAPSYGHTASGVQHLWTSGISNLDPAAAAGRAPLGRLDAEISYGIPVADHHLLITPFGGASLTGDGSQRYQLGGRLQLGTGFSLSIEGEHAASPSGTTDHTLSFDGTLNL